MYSLDLEQQTQLKAMVLAAESVSGSPALSNCRKYQACPYDLTNFFLGKKKFQSKARHSAPRK